VVSLQSLAQSEPWSEEQLAELKTRIRGAALKDWGAHVRRRRGHAAVPRIRELTGITPAMLPDEPDVQGWYPSWFQVALTDAIVQEYLGGDYLALEDLLFEDATRRRQKVVRWVAGKIGPAVVFKKAPQGHRDMYSQGAVHTTVGRRDATVTWTGARLYANPTWRMLQMMAVRLMMRVMKRSVSVLEGSELSTGQDGFRLRIEWR